MVHFIILSLFILSISANLTNSPTNSTQTNQTNQQKCGNECYFAVQDATLYIYGKGKMDNFTMEKSPWKQLSNNITSIIFQAEKPNLNTTSQPKQMIESTLEDLEEEERERKQASDKGITHIGCYAFYKFVNLKTIKFPDTLKVIEEGAFENCESLETLTLNKPLESLGSFAFKECFKLTSISIPESLKTIGNSVFDGCTKISKVDYYGKHNRKKKF